MQRGQKQDALKPSMCFPAPQVFPLCSGRNLTTISCLQRQGAAGQPGSSCAVHVRGGGWASALHPHELARGCAALLPLPGVGLVLRESSSSVLKGEREMYEMPRSVETLCSLFYFCIFVAEVFNQRVVTPNLSSGFRKCSA